LSLLPPRTLHHQQASTLISRVKCSVPSQISKSSGEFCQLEVWTHPAYNMDKAAHNTMADIREIIPKGVVAVSAVVHSCIL